MKRPRRVRTWWLDGKKERIPEGCQCWHSVGHYGVLNPDCDIHGGQSI